MSYVPNNPAVYLAAFSGMLSATGTVGRGNADFSAIVADAFAQAVDEAWGPGSFTALDVESIRLACSALWTSRSPLSYPAAIDPQSYGTFATAVVALAQSGTARVIAEGIDPNAGGDSSPETIGQLIFSFSTPSPQVLGPVPAGAVFSRALVSIEVPFDVPVAFYMGTTHSPTLILSPGDVTSSKVGQYASDELAVCPVADVLLFYLTSVGPTAGKGRLYYQMVSP